MTEQELFDQHHHEVTRDITVYMDSLFSEFAAMMRERIDFDGQDHRFQAQSREDNFNQARDREAESGSGEGRRPHSAGVEMPPALAG